MTDVFSHAKRSEIMSRVHGRGNRATELALVSLFRLNGITGWRRAQPVIGKPDFIFRAWRLAVFVDGCFWHGCSKHGTWPKQNAAFWRRKIRRNMARDREVDRTLRRMGWRVLRIWQHELVKRKEARLLARIRRAFER
jgi:DNA mismatch endonuclease (patch repair protein)